MIAKVEKLATKPMVQAQMDDDVAWWVDLGETVHVCKDRCWFKTYESLNDGSILYMENESTALVHGRGCVDLKFSFGKIVSLFNVLHVPNIKKNLVFSSVLNNYGYKQVIESNKFLLSKHGVFIGFGYLSNQSFRLNIVNDNIASAFMLTFKLNDSIIWHARLGHVLFKRMQDMSKDGLITVFDMETEKWNKKYFVTFIDDASRDAIFDENRFSSVLRPTLSIPNGTEDIGGLVVPKEVTKEDEVSNQHSYCFNVKDDPKTFDEAIKSQDVAFWKEEINNEMDSVMGNNTWVLADLPAVIQGFKQKSRIDYFDTYAPVADISTIRLLIAMALIHNLIIYQMKVKTTFLNGDLDEELYMNQLRASLCLSMETSKFDEFGKRVIIYLYVDDMLIFGTDQVQVDLTKEFLSSKFSMKDMGEADDILGIRIKHGSNGIVISQSHYIEKVLKKFNYIDYTPVSTHMDTSKKLMPNNGQVVSQLKYSRVIGFLMYAMTCTRPDIAFAVGKQSSADTLTKAYSQMYNGKSRHLDVRHSMIRELITNEVICIEFVRSQQNLAGQLTKGLARDLVIKSA
uniref:Zinc finger, CCHC-type n=1 Tax=Tanacetum cinerariifolium TaxID=118510 RepID=A0A699GIW4_TANCI|nr:zinc finger, CCHC-type [Tanacetum cinerariifolium]